MSNFLLFLVLEITSGGWVALAPSYIAVYPDTIVVEWTRDGLQPIRLLIFSFCCNFNYHFLIEKYNKKTTKAGKPWVFECGQVNLVSDVNNVSALPSPVLSIHPCDTRKPYYPYYSTDLPPVNTSSSLVTDFIPVVSFWYETADTKIGNLEENLLVNGNWDCYDGGITYPFTHRLPYDLRGIFLSIFTDDEDYQPNPVHLSLWRVITIGVNSRKSIGRLLNLLYSPYTVVTLSLYHFQWYSTTSTFILNFQIVKLLKSSQ